jgi:predicted HD phosphohydrolase
MADDISSPRTIAAPPGFRALTETTQSDWAGIVRADNEFAKGLPDWLLSHMTLLESECHGFAIDRLQHCLQTATRALRAGHDEEYVTCALFHDIGAVLAPADHAAFGAMILRPFISEHNHWMLHHHGIFQGYYFFHHLGIDRNAREQFRGHPCFEYTAYFCHQFDQAAFDPNYDTMPLAAFEPMVRRTLAVRKR